MEPVHRKDSVSTAASEEEAAGEIEKNFEGPFWGEESEVEMDLTESEEEPESQEMQLLRTQLADSEALREQERQQHLEKVGSLEVALEQVQQQLKESRASAATGKLQLRGLESELDAARGQNASLLGELERKEALLAEAKLGAAAAGQLSFVQADLETFRSLCGTLAEQKQALMHQVVEGQTAAVALEGAVMYLEDKVGHLALKVETSTRERKTLVEQHQATLAAHEVTVKSLHDRVDQLQRSLEQAAEEKALLVTHLRQHVALSRCPQRAQQQAGKTCLEALSEAFSVCWPQGDYRRLSQQVNSRA